MLQTAMCLRVSTVALALFLLLSPFLAPTAHADTIVIVEGTEPKVVNFDWEPVQLVEPGQQVMIAVPLKNLNQSRVSFVTIVEVRQSSGITEQLSFQTNTLEIGGETEFAVSWIPRYEDEWELRAFSFSELGFEQRVYSPLYSTTVTVS